MSKMLCNAFTTTDQWSAYIDEATQSLIGVRAFEGNPFRFLNLKGYELTDENIELFAEAFKNKDVNVLDLSSNKFGDQGAKALAAAIKVNKHIGGIYFSLGSDIELEQGIYSGRPINLSYNQIGKEGIEALFGIAMPGSYDITGNLWYPTPDEVESIMRFNLNNYLEVNEDKPE